MIINIETIADTLKAEAAGFDADVADAAANVAAAAAAANAANRIAYAAAADADAVVSFAEAAETAEAAAKAAAKASSAFAAAKAAATVWRKTTVRSLCDIHESYFQDVPSGSFAVIRRWCAGGATTSELRDAADAVDEKYESTLKFCPIESDLDELGVISSVYSAALTADTAKTNACFAIVASDAIDAIDDYV